MNDNDFDNYKFLPLKPVGLPPVQWSDLEVYADNYRRLRSIENLNVLLGNWEGYWNWAWGGDPPAIEYLFYLWNRMMALIEVKEDVLGSKLIRFTDAAAAQTVANKITCSLLSSLFLSDFTAVVNAELCFLNMEDTILEIVSDDHADYRRWHHMILLNRLMLALECFCFKTEISDEWEQGSRIPSSYEVLIERVHLAM